MHLIYESYVKLMLVAQIYSRTNEAIRDAQMDYQSSMDTFIRDFAPVPPPKDDNKWFDFLIDVATVGAASGFGKIFKAGRKILV